VNSKNPITFWLMAGGLAFILGFMIDQEIGICMYYRSAYAAALQKPQGDWDPSPHLQAVAATHRDGSDVGVVFGTIPEVMTAFVFARWRGYRWRSIGLGLVGGAAAAAIGGALCGNVP
jgi:hypothetical protein